MAHAFDAQCLGQLLAEAERLFAGAQDQQRRLTDVVTLVEGATAPVAPALGSASARLDTMPDLVATMRELRTVAEQQQQLAATLLARLIGSRSAFDGGRPRRLRVLIVDDSDSSRETTAAILEESGFDAITATNGLEGVIVAHYALPAVALMDLTMPVLDGLGAARLLRASVPTRNVKVIAFTARPDAHEEAVVRSFAGILAKPATAEAIVAAVLRVAPPDQRAPDVSPS